MRPGDFGRNCWRERGCHPEGGLRQQLAVVGRKRRAGWGRGLTVTGAGDRPHDVPAPHPPEYYGITATRGGRCFSAYSIAAFTALKGKRAPTSCSKGYGPAAPARNARAVSRSSGE
jgi:hypothetical protein